MLKKFLTILFTLALLSLSVLQVGFASENTDAYSVQFLENGDSIVTVIEDVSPDNLSMDKYLALPQSTNTVTKSKTSYYRDESGEVCWYVRVIGTFTYGDGSAKCILAMHQANSQKSEWKVSEISSSKSGNKATAKATGKKYYGGRIVKTVPLTVTLTCSPTGQFS